MLSTLLFLLGCGPSPLAAQVTAKELHGLTSQGEVHIIDVRTPEEFNAGHVPGAINIPLNTVPDNVNAFKHNETYVICRSGGRSGQAQSLLAKQQVTVTNVTGGTQAWIQAGYDIQK